MAYDGYRDPRMNPPNIYQYPDHRAPYPPQPFASPYPDSHDLRSPPPRPDGYPSEPMRTTASPPRNDFLPYASPPPLQQRNDYPLYSNSAPPPPPPSAPVADPYLGPEAIAAARSRAGSSVRPDDVRFPLPAGRPANEPAMPPLDRVDASAYPPELVAQITNQVLETLRATGVNKSPSPPARTRSNSSQRSAPPGPPPNRTSPHATSPEPVTVPPPPPPPPPTTSVPSSTSRDPRDNASTRPDHAGIRSPPLDASILRPQPLRMSVNTEETPLDRTWGRLFDDDEKPTGRLGQLLRGLANHIIKDFEPCNSIVVTPTKLAKFYETYRLSSEVYPWEYIFTRLTPTGLSGLYQKLDCQHHLVQEQHSGPPTIPGLTPVGFERWMTLLILGCPDEEWERLQMALQRMPISNADDTKERFPKDVSRRLFPKEPHEDAKRKVEAAFPVDPREQAKTTESDQTRGSDPSRLGAMLERARQPYSGTPAEAPAPEQPPRPERERGRDPYGDYASETAVEEPVKPTKIERERQPYVARPGGGKEYDGDAKSTAGDKRSSRVGSGTAGLEIPPPDAYRHLRTSSGVHHNAPSSSSSSRRRGRSPSISSGSEFRRSENDLPGRRDTGGSLDLGSSSDTLMDNLTSSSSSSSRRYGDNIKWAPRVPEDEIRHHHHSSHGHHHSSSHGFDLSSRDRDRDRYDRRGAGGGGAGAGVGYDEEEWYRQNGNNGGGSGNGYGYDSGYSGYR